MKRVIRVLGRQRPQRPVGGGGRQDGVASGGEHPAALELGPDLLAAIRCGSDNLLPPADRLLLQLSDVLSQGPEVYRLVTDVFTQHLLDPGERGDGGPGGPLVVPLLLWRAASQLVLAEPQILGRRPAPHEGS